MIRSFSKVSGSVKGFGSILSTQWSSSNPISRRRLARERNVVNASQDAAQALQ